MSKKSLCFCLLSGFGLLFLLFISEGRTAPQKPQVRELLSQLQSSNLDLRWEAAVKAGPIGAEAVVPLEDLMGGEDRGVTKAATEALRRIAHYSARPGARKEAQAVARELLKLTDPKRPRFVRVEALYLLGCIGDEKVVPPLEKLLYDPQVREEARLALERIPGKSATNALRRALKKVPEDFRANLQQSLRHRQMKPSTVGITPSYK